MGTKKLELRIVAPGVKLEKQPPQFADMIVLPCTTGELGVLPGRLPCTMVLGNGNVRVVEEGQEVRIKVSGGIATVGRDVVTVLSNYLEI